MADPVFAKRKNPEAYAPENSDVPIGTAYQWYILSHQHVKKLNAKYAAIR